MNTCVIGKMPACVKHVNHVSFTVPVIMDGISNQLTKRTRFFRFCQRFFVMVKFNSCATLSLFMISLSFLMGCNRVYCFILPRDGASRGRHSILASSPASGQTPDESNKNRQAEFQDLEPIEESSIRIERKRKSEEISKKFVAYGDDLWRLRSVMHTLSRQLLVAISNGIPEEEEKVRSQLREIEKQDPELTYEMELKKLHIARTNGNAEEVERHGENALEARGCIPAYNLEGLWVGK